MAQRRRIKTEISDFKGQGTRCHGQLRITLQGPQGCGKSLVAKLLRALLPLTPLADVQIVEVQE